jgi:hypothetical protein
MAEQDQRDRDAHQDGDDLGEVLQEDEVVVAHGEDPGATGKVRDYIQP